MHIFASLESFVIKLLHNGYFTRGAAVKGRLYHDSEMVLGNASVQAYSLEQTVARYPRIMLTREVFLDSREYASVEDMYGDEFENCAQQAADGPHYLHILRNLKMIGNKLLDPGTRKDLLDSFNETAVVIQQRFDESMDNPRHFEKIQWLAAYWNHCIYGHQNLVKINGPGLSIPMVLE
jgi:hypothetical protein